VYDLYCGVRLERPLALWMVDGRRSKITTQSIGAQDVARYAELYHYLSDLFAGNLPLINYFIDAVASIVGGTNQKKLYVLYEVTHSSGKSTLLRVLKTLLGDMLVSLPLRMLEGNVLVDEALSLASKARVTFVDNVDGTSRLNAWLVNAITSEVPVWVNNSSLSPSTSTQVTCRGSLMLGASGMPRMRMSERIIQRLHPIPLPAKFSPTSPFEARSFSDKDIEVIATQLFAVCEARLVFGEPPTPEPTIVRELKKLMVKWADEDTLRELNYEITNRFADVVTCDELHKRVRLCIGVDPREFCRRVGTHVRRQAHEKYYGLKRLHVRPN
jgi:hypothetical protein